MIAGHLTVTGTSLGNKYVTHNIYEYHARQHLDVIISINKNTLEFAHSINIKMILQ